MYLVKYNSHWYKLVVNTNSNVMTVTDNNGLVSEDLDGIEVLIFIDSTPHTEGIITHGSCQFSKRCGRFPGLRTTEGTYLKVHPAPRTNTNHYNRPSRRRTKE